MKAISIPNAVIDRVQSRVAALHAAYRLVDQAQAAYEGAVAANAPERAQLEQALIDTGGGVVNAAQTLLFSARLLLEMTKGTFPSLNHRLLTMQQALRAETIAFETYDAARPGEIEAAFETWKAARAEVVRVGRQLLSLGGTGNADETDLDTSADHGTA